jgi:DNA-binding beta-propeller fold protein YncE
VPAAGAVFVTKWGTEGTGDGQFQTPHGIKVAPDGNVYVADNLNARIQKFTSEGVFVSKWGTYGSGDGQFQHPRGIAVASDGSVYVMDSNTQIIQKFTPEGVFVTTWDTNPTGLLGTSYDYRVPHPFGVAVASDGSVYVSDYGNNRIQKFAGE